MRYQIVGLHKIAEEDSFENGCQPEGGTIAHIDVSFSGKTTEEVIKKAASFLCIDEDGIERDSCEEGGRVDFARTEDAEGSELYGRDIERWKRGEIKAWYAVYTGYVEKVEPVSTVIQPKD